MPKFIEVGDGFVNVDHITGFSVDSWWGIIHIHLSDGRSIKFNGRFRDLATMMDNAKSLHEVLEVPNE